VGLERPARRDLGWQKEGVQMSELRVEEHGHVRLVVFDNPPVNAMSPEWDIQGTFDTISADEDARVIVITGQGDRVFCAGADIKAAARGDRALRPERTGSREGRENFYSIMECAVPVIGAINGPALGAGLAIAASCDYLIASERAVFGLPEIDVGLLGGARHAMRLFPQQTVRKMHYTAERLGAEEAYRLGAVDRVVPVEELLDAAMHDAEVIASKMPIGIRLAKENLNLIEEMDLRNGYRFEQTRTAILQKTEDAMEAKVAFAEKRQPVYHGR
jgi:enoyl-CoA hydratase/carnithine racemase